MGKVKKAKEVQDWQWVGDPIQMSEVQRRWPERKRGLQKPEDYCGKEYMSAAEVRANA
jgi:hypothetical protein